MAIKGKKKKSGGRAKAAAPKRPLVAPKPTFIRRKGVQVAIASLLALTMGLILGWAIWHGPTIQERALTSAESAKVAEAKIAIEAALDVIGHGVPPGEFLAFPDLMTGLEAFGRGKLRPTVFSDQVQRADEAAKAASDQIGNLDVTSIARNLPEAPGVQLTTAHHDFGQALFLYSQVSQMLDRATTESGERRFYLIKTATSLLRIADGLMSHGYKNYLLVVRAAGLQSATSAGVRVSG